MATQDDAVAEVIARERESLRPEVPPRTRPPALTSTRPPIRPTGIHRRALVFPGRS
jgi:hypothetical protein